MVGRWRCKSYNDSKFVSLPRSSGIVKELRDLRHESPWNCWSLVPQSANRTWNLRACCCIQMKSRGQTVSLPRHQNICPVLLIFCIGMKWYKGLVWILLTMYARSLQANRGGGAGLSLMHGLADIVQSHPWTFHCRRQQSRSASRTQRSCKLEKQNPCCLRMLRCVAIWLLW